MNIFWRNIAFFVASLLFFSNVYALNSSSSSREFWHPFYRGERLGYCTYCDHKCGLPVANRYCRMMGYAYADRQIIGNNVGLTNFIDKRFRCKGWRCNGFKLIRCVKQLRHTPPQSYYYTSKRFVYPRFNRYRIDWCYDGSGQGCGYRVAQSFCRRMGYLKARSYRKDPHIAATQALGNQKLCFGPQCNAFKFIDCSR